MSNLPLLGETALLMAVAYFAGCLFGSALRRVPHRLFRRPVVTAATTPSPMAILDTAVLPALPPPTIKAEPALPPPMQAEAQTGPDRTAANEPPMALMDAALSWPTRPVATIITLPRREPISASADIAAIGRPPALAAALNGTADDLRRIKGIGPRLESSLNALGIFHFDQIARWNEMNLVWIDAQPHLRGRAIRDAWVAQAAALCGIDSGAPTAVPSKGIAEPLKAAN